MAGVEDLALWLASPKTADKLCGSHGVTAGDEVNCSGGHDVVMNLKRWLLLNPYYQGQPALYHALAINHEIGHHLDFGHMACPGKGKPAPVMQQQIFGLHGCSINAWPYDARGQFLSGPPKP